MLRQHLKPVVMTFEVFYWLLVNGLHVERLDDVVDDVYFVLF